MTILGFISRAPLGELVGTNKSLKNAGELLEVGNALGFAWGILGGDASIFFEMLLLACWTLGFPLGCGFDALTLPGHGVSAGGKSGFSTFPDASGGALFNAILTHAVEIAIANPDDANIQDALTAMRAGAKTAFKLWRCTQPAGHIAKVGRACRVERGSKVVASNKAIRTFAKSFVKRVKSGLRAHGIWCAC